MLTLHYYMEHPHLHNNNNIFPPISKIELFFFCAWNYLEISLKQITETVLMIVWDFWWFCFGFLLVGWVLVFFFSFLLLLLVLDFFCWFGFFWGGGILGFWGWWWFCFLKRRSESLQPFSSEVTCYFIL